VASFNTAIDLCAIRHPCFFMLRPTLIAWFVFPAVASALDFSSVTSGGKGFTVCRVGLATERLQLFLRDAAGKPLKGFANVDAMLAPQGQRLTFAMNGGMYKGDLSPVGLCVQDGREVTPLNLANAEGNFFLKPNGVFFITEHGAQVIESTEYPGLKVKPSLATQSGPMLLLHGRLHPVFREGSKNRLYRNGVGIVSPQVVVFAISDEPVNFHEFALLFRDALHCADALFLDGTVSSLHSPALLRSDKRMDLGPILGITVRK
jgi:uncharacterized protein YigE (DUF2233 family)